MQLGLGIVVATSSARADVVVHAPDGTTLGQVAPQLLAAVLPEPARGTLSIGGIPLDPRALLGLPPLVEGVLLEVDACARPAHLDGSVELRVVGGPATGAVHHMAPGDVVVGRAGALRLDDPEVSRKHCRLRITHDGATITDLGSTNGTYVDGERVSGEAALPYDGLLRVGDSTLQLTRAAEPPAPVTSSGDGRLAYNRPPRIVPPRQLVQVVVPAPPAERERSPVPVLAALAPLVLGIVMWRVLGNATFLLFTLLSPVLMLGNVVSERRRGTRQTRRDRALWQAQRDVAEQTLRDAVAADETYRRTAAPDPAVVLLTALGPRPRLWERRRADADALDVRLGLADQPAVVEADGDVPEGMATACSVPVVVPLRSAGVLGVSGPRPGVQALGRWLLLQTATLTSPRDLQVVVLAEPAAAPAWEWARWLPHLAPEGRQDCRATLGLGTAQAAARVAELSDLVEARRAERVAAGARARSDERPVLLLLDGARGLRTIPGLSSLLAEGPGVGVFTIALEQDRRLLPEECGATAVITGTRVDLEIAGAPAIVGAVADGVSASYGEKIARALAPLRDHSRDRAGLEGLPASARWTDVADLPLTGSDDDAAQVVARWVAPGRTTAAVLGRAPDGVFAVDIARDGPHTLVAGTTGAGKSELLQTLIASLVAGNRPDELQLVLVDYKGGAAFGPCARLPHTVGLVTDLDGPLVERAIASLSAELKRREAILAGVGAKDLDDYRRGGRGPLARLVIVVDEFASLAEELPEFVGGLVGIAQRGRSLGVHLVLATQRPEGVVSADIRANTNLRLCLAVTRDAESRDVLDSPVAATISRVTPGRAYARTGHADLTPFQTARVGGRRPAVVRPDATPTVALLPAADLGEPLPRGSAGETADETDLSLLVDACRTAADRLAIPPQRSPWLPPLPPAISLDDLPREGLVLGVVDVPEAQAQRPLVLDLDRSTHLMVLGSPRSGRTTALRTFAGSVARCTSADDVHLYVVDPGGGLGAVAALPHTGAVVGRDSPQRVDRVLTYLVAEVTRRQALLGAAGHAGLAEQRATAAPADRLPHLVLLLDRWEAFLAAYQELDAGRLVELVYRLLREGPSAGLHVVLTADRSGLVGRVSSMIAERLVLRLADRGDYPAAGIPTRLVPDELPPGRGWFVAGAPLVAQVALLAADPSGPAQTAALRALAAAAAPAQLRPPHRIEPLPAAVALSSLGCAGGDTVVLGVAGDELAPAVVDLRETGFLIGGPRRSGRSTALLTIARQLIARGQHVVAVAPRPSPLRELPGCLTDGEASYDLETALAGRPAAVLVDDAELLVDSAVGHVLERLVRGMRDTPCTVVAAGTTQDLITGYRGFVVELRRSRAGLLLSPQSPADGDLVGVRLSRGVGADLTPGRGLLCTGGTAEPLQVAVPD